ncbi:MAG: cobalt-precorrin-5B (C(1))-methyltransferase CbiD [Lawsonibacter sp.]|nr:cobalamin biosynthesis protein CbiD [Oscillospiraceae bacterium]
MSFEHYVTAGGKRLRCGYTTGTCAALAAAAAARLLLTGRAPETVSLHTPKGWNVEVPVETPCLEGGAACCCVTKDGGDDVDATHGLPICARVEAIAGEGILLQGGSGVGRVTRPGLDQPVGEWAINHIPRQMIREAVDAVRRELDEPGGLCVTIFVPGGEEAARKTFNPHLGIEGGISILGTSGIVEPMSVKAIVETTALELRQAAASGARRMVLTPGNYGMEFLARGGVALPAGVPVVRCSNFIGEALDGAGAEGFSSVLLVGHIGKLVKLAGGIMNTHSRWADGRAELFCAHAALCGADRDTARALMDSATADQCLAVLDRAGLRAAVMSSLLEAVQRHLDRRAAGQFAVGAVTFSNQYGLLGMTRGAKEILKTWQIS